MIMTTRLTMIAVPRALECEAMACASKRSIELTCRSWEPHLYLCPRHTFYTHKIIFFANVTLNKQTGHCDQNVLQTKYHKYVLQIKSCRRCAAVQNLTRSPAGLRTRSLPARGTRIGQKLVVYLGSSLARPVMPGVKSVIDKVWLGLQFIVSVVSLPPLTLTSQQQM